MIIRLLKNWRKAIPAMDCEPGCHACCEGFVPAMMKEEWYRINHPGKYSTGQPITACPFLGAQGCEIYHQRPIICRLYGTVAKEEAAATGFDELGRVCCPKEKHPATPLSPIDAWRLQSDYVRYQQRELRQTIEDFKRWLPLANPDEMLPQKFEWLNYFTATETGQKFLEMQLNPSPLSPEQEGKYRKMQELMEARA